MADIANPKAAAENDDMAHKPAGTEADEAETSPPEPPSAEGLTDTDENAADAVPEAEPDAMPTDEAAPEDPDGAPEESPTASDPVAAAADTPQAAETAPRGPASDAAAMPIAAAPPSRGGAGGLILGGVIAALIGAGALYLAQSQDWVTLGGPDEALLARLDALETGLDKTEADLAAATEKIAALEQAEPDLSAVTAAIGKVQTAADATAADLAALTERLDATDARLSELAVTQIPEAELPKAISDAYDAKLSDLLATINTRFAKMQTGLDTKLTELEQSQQDAAKAEADALRAAQMAEARAAMGKVRTALDTGAPYAGPLAEVADLSGAGIPDPLAAHAEEGIPTLDALRTRFPEGARRALTLSSRVAAESGEMSRWEAFLRTQTGARSLEAREGGDPDAVLSRAEAALARGDLDTALTELKALPEAGQDAMADWAALAETRRDALNAAADLAARIEQN